jgi:hypothetical protein
MPVVVPDALITVDLLEEYLHQQIAAKDASSAAAAVEFARAFVVQRIGFDPATATVTDYTVDPPVSDEDSLVARGVALRIAAQWFTNPQDRASYAGPEGLSYTASPQMLSRILSEADRVVLELVQLKYNPGF